MIGKCDPLVSKLALDLKFIPEDYDPENLFEFYQNMTSMCKTISKCYQSLSSESAKKLKKIYDFRAEKYEFHSYDMVRCFVALSSEQYSSSYSSECKIAYDFKTNDLVAKRKSLNSARDCIMELANRRCFNISNRYLSSNYDKFVEILTVKPEDNYCDSIHVVLNRLQCDTNRRLLKRNWDEMKKYKNYGSEFQWVADGKQQCSVLQQCHSDVCNEYPSSKQLEKCEIFDAIGSEFHSCFEKFGEKGSLTFAECKNSTDTKECIRRIMTKNCGEGSVKDFDYYYKWFTANNLKTLKVFKKFGNYTDVERDTSNKIPIDSEVGKCFPFVEKLMTGWSGAGLIKYYQQRIDICFNITNCYGSIDSEESQNLKKYYQFACDHFLLSRHATLHCLDYFYYRNRVRLNATTIESSKFFSKNESIRRDAFKTEKEYFMQHVNENCQDRAKKYLNIESNYDHYVDLITIPTTNDDCSSVYSILGNSICTGIIEYYYDKDEFERTMDSNWASFVLQKCAQAKSCLEGFTCLTWNSRKMLNYCNLEQPRNIYFYACLDTMNNANQKYSNDFCDEIKIEKQKTGEDYLMHFEHNPECLKSIMLETCGLDGVRNFEEYFKKVVQDYKLKQ